MAYIPDPAVITEPQDTVDSSTAAAEFRKLKEYIQTYIMPYLSGTPVPYNYIRNKIIGGDFTTNPWQRGTSFVAIASGAYCADRFVFNNTSAAVLTVAKTADAPAAADAGLFSQHCLHFDVTTADAALAAGDAVSFSQHIEGLNAANFGFGQAGSRYVTLSFWIKSPKTGIHCVSLRNSAVNRSYVAEYTVNAVNTWEKKTVTIPVDTAGTWLYDTGIGLSVTWALAVGTTLQTPAGAWTAGNFIASANQVNCVDNVANDFKIALVQLEAGATATSFEVRSISEVLEQCFRYYEATQQVLGSTSYGPGTGEGLIYNFYYKVRKRVVPTVTVSNYGHVNSNTGSVYLTGVDGVVLSANSVAGAGSHGIQPTYTVNAEL